MRRKRFLLVFSTLLLILGYVLFWRHSEEESHVEIAADGQDFANLVKDDDFPDIPNTTLTPTTTEEHHPGLPQALEIFIIMTNMKTRSNLGPNFHRFFTSLTEFASKPINLHIICDQDSKKYLTSYSNSTDFFQSKVPIKLLYYNAKESFEKARDVVMAMKPHFSSASGSYYSDDLFFLSLGLHQISSLNQVLLLDIDIQFRADVVLLFQFFELFNDDQMFGLAPELSPVYKHVLYKYLNKLKENPQKIGEPDIEDGYSGFNSGVVLLDLEKMRLSAFYETLVSTDSVNELSVEFEFKGHLGDQDFFTLMGIKSPELIFKLPCAWNRQMCQWWREHGYADVFDRYFACEGKVKIYHANCNSSIPQK
ncbi:xyloside xylosyltransferase 1-like [Neocloeon triangulifer]|uniref:xyloside xylosyltransferase 1-like n=1 Tax=Neocloeon triangulifer TaxID=2078957 RepID=UPI00286F0853|nr:xyloside xylosyltransferase 1-like [Neocloeon triangulifer]XP_059491162.1 xyloside xylosyltransferase 1-like [Neocloeon triangulifer]